MTDQFIQTILDKETEAIRNIPVDGSFSNCLDLIHEAVHENKGKLVISGMGKAGQIGHNMATTFASTGTPSIFLHPSESQHGDLGMLQDNDILLLISNSGKTREIIELIYLAKQLHPNIKIIALTGNLESELVEKSDVSLYTGGPEEVCPLGLTPTTSTTCMTVIGDILVSGMIKKIKFTKQDYAKRHHSGYLGQKARS